MCTRTNYCGVPSPCLNFISNLYTMASLCCYFIHNQGLPCGARPFDLCSQHIKIAQRPMGEGNMFQLLYICPFSSLCLPGLAQSHLCQINKSVTLNQTNTQCHWLYVLEWGCSVGPCMLVDFHIKFSFLLSQTDIKNQLLYCTKSYIHHLLTCLAFFL